MTPATAPCRLLPRARMIRQSANDGARARLLVSSGPCEQAFVDVEELAMDE